MKVYTFQVGAVALDFDAPTEYFWDYNGGAGMMNEGVRLVCEEIAQKWQLGRFWMYRTLSGVHVIFERLMPTLEDALDVLLDANDREGWKQCGGHMAMCAGSQLTLRTGVKDSCRPFDIYPLDVVDGTAPSHVQEHHKEVCDATQKHHI